MGIRYQIIYHEAVRQIDLPKITKTWQVKLQQAIETKLTVEPALYGKPLRRSLHGYYKLRVGDYRVVFQIKDAVVKIFMIRHRSDIYEEVGWRVV